MDRINDGLARTLKVLRERECKQFSRIMSNYLHLAILQDTALHITMLTILFKESRTVKLCVWVSSFIQVTANIGLALDCLFWSRIINELNLIFVLFRQYKLLTS